MRILLIMLLLISLATAKKVAVIYYAGYGVQCKGKSLNEVRLLLDW